MPIRDAILAQREQSGGAFEQRRDVLYCEMVGIDSSTDPGVTGKLAFIWAKQNGRSGGIFQVFNPHVQRRVGLPILVGPSPQRPNRLMVLGVDWQTLAAHPDYGGGDYEGDPYLANHAPSHEQPDFSPGGDAVNVYPRAFTQLKTTGGTSGLTVDVAAYRYSYNLTTVDYDGETAISISTHQPAAGAHLFVLVYLDPVTNTAASTAGDATALTVEATKPASPAGTITSAYILLNGAATSITEKMIYDGRMPFCVIGPDSDQINEGLALIEAQWDYAFSRHITG